LLVRREERLAELRAANELWWSAEAEVFAAYWDAPRRSLATDLRWIARQCHKELYDGVVLRERELQTASADAHAALAQIIAEERDHLDAFADVYARFRGDAQALTEDYLRELAWPENDALAELRTRHKHEFGAIGAIASTFTEGGGGALYIAGMSRAGRGGIDDAIAKACAVIYDDEQNHMTAGFAQLDIDWNLLTELTVEQSELRVPMREAQFR
jgi:hypothetical protein